MKFEITISKEAMRKIREHMCCDEGHEALIPDVDLIQELFYFEVGCGDILDLRSYVKVKEVS